MYFENLGLLQLLQLADSALPIGSTAHSAGLETLVIDEELVVEQLPSYLSGYLQENGVLEGLCCRQAYRLKHHLHQHEACVQRWLEINQYLSALKVARESRTASTTLGRRFLQLLQQLQEFPLLNDLLYRAKTSGEDLHYCTAFGLAGGLLQIEEDAVVLAYLQQHLGGLVSACQRLLPLGQNQASRIVWQLKPQLIEVARASADPELTLEDCMLFTPLLDLGSMRHPMLTTRLFIS